MALFARQLRRKSDYGSGSVYAAGFECRDFEEELSFHLVDSDDVDAWVERYRKHQWSKQSPNMIVGVCFVSTEDLQSVGIVLDLDDIEVADDPFSKLHHSVKCPKLTDSVRTKLADQATKHAQRGLFRPHCKKVGNCKDLTA
jgi:hypothetical protein